MQSKKLSDWQYLIKLEKGEEIVNSLRRFCGQEKIEGGLFWGIGAVGRAEIAHYSIIAKKYTRKVIKKPLEIAGLQGNIALAGGEFIIHGHIVLSDEKFNCLAGHLVEAVVSVTAEIYLTKTEKLVREKDKTTGLKLLKLK